MNKILQLLQLHRLNFSNQASVLNYFLKRGLHLKTKPSERYVYDYYLHLIGADGFLMNESATNYVSRYKNPNLTLKIRKKPSSDLSVYNQVNKHLEYKPVVDVYKQNFKTHSELNIIDAGSNIGLTSVYLSQHFPNSRFIAIEPDDSNFDMVSFNLEANGIKNAVKIKGGLWSKNTNLKIVNDFRDKKDWSIRVEETDDEGDLKAYSVNSLMSQYQLKNIDILKIDIEGSEKEVFTGTDADVSFLAKTKCIAIEIHDEFDCRSEINAILTQYNFTFFDSGELTIGINQNLI